MAERVRGEHSVVAHGELAVGNLPGRKQPALYENRRGVIHVLAYFRSQDEMNRFLQFRPTFVRSSIQ